MALDYQYTPLDQATKSIRIIKLYPAAAPEETLCCEILTEDFLAPSSHPYEAISYTWDGQVPSPDHAISCAIKEDGSVREEALQLTKNSSEALRRFRLRHGFRLLWIDSVCIDQSNPQEKSHQVVLMSEIYAHAKLVLVWLGPDPTSNGKRIFDFLAACAALDPDKEKERGQLIELVAEIEARKFHPAS